ncbi:HIT-like protein [Thozetella sp. PMI_491]|nr:HIT-like protein [Thozetella sp. PMI_491]
MAEPAEDIADITPDLGEEAEAAPSNSAQETESKGGGSSANLAKRNAFSELMAPKPKVQKSDATSSKLQAAKSAVTRALGPRSGLLAYINNPERYPPNIVLRANANTVLIKDMYPKATVHLLLLPRSPAHYGLHPHEAFEDPEFLAMMKEEAAVGAQLAAAELQRLLASTSATTKARYAAMEADYAPDEIPPARDFSGDIRVGIHAHPSMEHLHVHIMSRDMHSEKLRHRKHYNSFNTPFFVPLADYPLAPDDERRKTSYQNANLKKDFICWRCGNNFGDRFPKLKSHLEAEFQAWSRE